MESPTKSPRKRIRLDNDSISSKALRYFKPIESRSDEDKRLSKTHKCIICQESFNGSKKWNLASHLQHCHAKEYVEISINETIALKRLKLLHSCTEMVTVNGRPFSCLHDSGFQNAIHTTLEELRAAHIPLNLSDYNLTVVKNQISQTAAKIRAKIQAEVRGRPLSLLVDIVTKHKRSILGVSLQYNFNGMLKIRSIGFIELWDRHTGKYLATVIIKRLELLEIKLKQIFTVTTDNGKNVLKMVRDMTEYLNAEIKTQNQQTPQKNSAQDRAQTPSDDEQTDTEIMDLLRNVYGPTDEDALDIVMDEVALDEHETLLGAMVQEISADGGDIEWDITGVNCAPHTLQLGVHDSIKALSTNHGNVLLLAREVCKFLNLRTTITDLKKLGIEYSYPRLETKTRWSSMYLMVSFLRIYFNAIY